MSMPTRWGARAAPLLVLLLLPLLPAQTIGVPFANDLVFDVGPAGLPFGPPGGAPCGFAPPFAPPAGVPFTINVTAPAPGLPVLLFVDLGPCLPGFACLPPAAGPYGVIPPVAGPCIPFTNQSVDLAPTAFLLDTGVTGPALPGGMYMSPVFVAPMPPVGIIVSVQAMILDPAAGTPFGIVVSNAADLVL